MLSSRTPPKIRAWESAIVLGASGALIGSSIGREALEHKLSDKLPPDSAGIMAESNTGNELRLVIGGVGALISLAGLTFSFRSLTSAKESSPEETEQRPS